MERILVIGSSGQIGTELVEELRVIYGNENVVASDIRQPQIEQDGPFEILDILNKVEDALGAGLWSRVRVECGRTFFQDFIDHDDVRKAYDRYQDGEKLRDDPRSGFEFGDIIWEQYRGAVGGTKFVADNEPILKIYHSLPNNI